MRTLPKKISKFFLLTGKVKTFPDKNSYHDFFIITIFDDKADKLKGFL